MNRMHKVLYLLFLPALVLCGCSFVLKTQDKDPDKAAPQIYYPEAVHDFGTISRGGSVSHVFAVRNTGNAPLRLLGVKDT